MTDPDRFLSLLDGARQAVAVLARYRETVPRERVLSDVDTQNMVLFALYRAVQGAIALGQHLIAERGLPVPGAYREVFRALADAGVLDADLGERMQRWGGFRNVIAHHYGVIDYDLVARALHDDVADLEAFLGRMAAIATGEKR